MNVPSINVIENLARLRRSMLMGQILFHPLDEMVLEATFDQLMEKIRRHHLMYVSTGEIIGEELHI